MPARVTGRSRGYKGESVMSPYRLPRTGAVLPCKEASSSFLRFAPTTEWGFNCCCRSWNVFVVRSPTTVSVDLPFMRREAA